MVVPAVNLAIPVEVEVGVVTQKSTIFRLLLVQVLHMPLAQVVLAELAPAVLAATLIFAIQHQIAGLSAEALS